MTICSFWKQYQLPGLTHSVRFTPFELSEIPLGLSVAIFFLESPGPHFAEAPHLSWFLWTRAEKQVGRGPDSHAHQACQWFCPMPTLFLSRLTRIVLPLCSCSQILLTNQSFEGVFGRSFLYMLEFRARSMGGRAERLISAQIKRNHCGHPSHPPFMTALSILNGISPSGGGEHLGSFQLRILITGRSMKALSPWHLTVFCGFQMLPNHSLKGQWLTPMRIVILPIVELGGIKWIDPVTSREKKYLT